MAAPREEPDAVSRHQAYLTNETESVGHRPTAFFCRMVSGRLRRVLEMAVSATAYVVACPRTATQPASGFPANSVIAPGTGRGMWGKDSRKAISKLRDEWKR